MKALLTAGGHGTRLRPITHTQNKHLIPVANKPMLFYGLEGIAGAGIREVGIIVGDTEDEIRAAVGDGSSWGLEVTYLHQDAPLGLAHVVLTAQEFLGDQPFLMHLGDNLVRERLDRSIRVFREQQADAQVFLVKVPEPSRFGVAVLEGERIVRLVEKPREHVSDYALAGVYVFGPAIFRAAASLEPSWRGELEITDAIQYLVDHGYDVRAERLTGWWKDTGRLEDLLEANRFALDDQERLVEGDVDEASHLVGEVRVDAGAVVRESVIRGPAAIASGCRIERSTIDPYTSIYLNTTLLDSEIGNSIVMEDCVIQDVRRIRDSLVGRNVRVARGDSLPASVQLMVGDNSAITLP
ncbi:MAG: glucose-1-phosphate thymidylyltransferase [Actinomycetota bacterium]|nr:glucose-1-phosphate thymidylyltransferase [Actinomycetota bacterium]